MSPSSGTEAPSRGESTADVARLAGRGTILITAAKAWFIVSGAGIHFSLPRMMSAEQFGVYQVVISAVSIINAVVVAATSQAVSKYISQEEGKADSVRSKSLRLQTLVGGTISLGFFLLSPVLAHLLNDARLTPYLRLAALITLAYSFYSVYVGYFNGKKLFLAQAGLDMTYSTLKLGLIVFFVWLGYGVAGGVGGFALAAGCALALSAYIARGGTQRGDVRAVDVFKFQTLLLMFTLVLNVLQRIDLMLIKSLSSVDTTIASTNAGYYGAAVNVANVTYQSVVAVAAVVFPLVSQSSFAEDKARTQKYVSNTLRFTLLIMALMAAVFSANAGEVLRLIYPDEFVAAAGALSIVAFGILFFGVLNVETTMISAMGKPEVGLIIGAITLGANWTLNSMLIPSRGIKGAAIGTTASMLLGAALASGYVLRKTGALIPLRALARIGIAAGIVFAGSAATSPASRLLIVVKLITLSLAYFGALLVTREIGREDFEAVKSIVRR